MVSLEIERILGTQFQISLKWENTKCFFQLFWPLVQWLANFCKSPISKCFRFCQPDDLCGNYSNGYSATVAWMQAQTTCKGMGVVTIGLQASLCSRLKTTVAEPQPTTTHGSWLGSGLRAVASEGGDSCKTFWGWDSRPDGECLSQANGGSSADERGKLRDILELNSAGHGKPWPAKN